MRNNQVVIEKLSCSCSSMKVQFRGTIPSVSPSPALVSGLMVVRAIQYIPLYSPSQPGLTYFVC
nr:hypothetical protein Q903MT_gene5989 [Picea sitchensis]